MNLIEWNDELRFLVAIALGFLVGLERETRGNLLNPQTNCGCKNIHAD